MTARTVKGISSAAAFAGLTLPCPASAHAFGARYDLPLPLWLYLSGAGAAVALTFIILALFSRANSDGGPPNYLALPLLTRLVCCRPVRLICAFASIFIFSLVLLAGFFGQQDPIHNLAPTFVWVIWWVGLVFFVSVTGNIWPALNPWTAIYDAVRWVAGQSGISANGPPRACPSSLGVWPSVLLFVVFAWLEIVSSVGEHPATLACLILAYSILTLYGMVIFGRDSWLSSGEVFHQVFGALGRFSLFGTRDGIITLRPFGAGLFTSAPVHPSMMAFIILLLSTVTFDGFVETPVWAGLLEEISESRFLRPMLIWMQSIGIDLLVTIKTGALLIFPVVFLAIFWTFCAASRAIADGNVSVSQLANTLVLSLVPIAIAYHIAHYLSYLLIAGQLIVPLASDPFGWGWDLFGTASQAMDVGVINSATVWYVAVVAIVLGHVIAVWVAHSMAMSLYKDARRSLLSQIPMLLLMVLYTMTSLWILSQPIVEG